ncbi:MAG: hypothetical protein IPK58_18055 [Acidobacteria bacterium]|nr:hypothetical protein [Acidobacteriota bacterium]
MSEANKPDAVSVYDALGNRVAEKVNDVWQFVIYDAFGKLVAEYGGTRAESTFFRIGRGRPTSFRSPTATDNIARRGAPRKARISGNADRRNPARRR